MEKINKIKTRIRYFLNYFQTLFNGEAKKSKKILEELKDSHKGERCFVIGNGPSLTPQDLDKLKNEYTFASNRIYNIFPKTEWRPTYFAVFDGSVAATKGVIDGINTIPCEMKFVRREGYHIYRKINGPLCYVHTRFSRKYLDAPRFSTDASMCVYTIAAVTYTMFQLAVHMGFSEIYLIGMDNRYAFTVNRDGTVVENKNVTSHFEGDIEKAMKTAVSTWEMDAAYEYAKEFSQENGFKIYNATRGGYLETFERVDFDSLFEKE